MGTMFPLRTRTQPQVADRSPLKWSLDVEKMVVKRAFLLTPTPVFGGVAQQKIR
jgi:hypothetical protein